MPTDVPGAVRATLLGTGTSTGVPIIGCGCRVCRSADPRDRRMRCACHVESGGVHLQIDAGPDFRAQALRFGVERVDAVLFTHHHFDHVAGIDDLRPFLFGNRAPIPCYALPETAEALRHMYGYIFRDRTYPGVPNLELRVVEGPFVVTSRYDPELRVAVDPIPAWHGALPVAGYRIGRFAYLTDVNRLGEGAEGRLAGLEVLVLDALRRESHPTHFSIGEAVEAARRIGAARTAFVHMTHSVLHAEESALLPEGVELGHDGLVFDC